MTSSLTLPPDIEQSIVNAAEACKMTEEEYIDRNLEMAHLWVKPASLANKSTQYSKAAMMIPSQLRTPAGIFEKRWSRGTKYGNHA